MRAKLLRYGLALFAASLSAAIAAREISVQEAIAKAQHETQGKVLSAQTLRLGKRKIYRIKILTSEGQVRIVQVSADQ
jgi:uncharacterized membrane protein YkoI